MAFFRSNLSSFWRCGKGSGVDSIGRFKEGVSSFLVHTIMRKILIIVLVSIRAVMLVAFVCLKCVSLKPRLWK